MQKHTWDTRAWLIGIVGGAVIGSLAAWSVYPASQNKIDALPRFAPPGYTNGGITSVTLNIIMALVLPGLLSGIARRRTFLWGLVPLTLSLAARDVEDWAENSFHIVWNHSLFFLIMFGICWVVSSGPVSLIRWLRVLAIRRHAARLALILAQQQAASVPQEGVWPPPPERRE